MCSGLNIHVICTWKCTSLILLFYLFHIGSEDIIVDNLSTDNLTSVLNWSSEAHGSPWVHRQGLHFLMEEFIQIAHSPVLHDLSKEYIIEALRSDFLQVKYTLLDIAAGHI